MMGNSVSSVACVLCGTQGEVKVYKHWGEGWGRAQLLLGCCKMWRKKPHPLRGLLGKHLESADPRPVKPALATRGRGGRTVRCWPGRHCGRTGRTGHQRGRAMEWKTPGPQVSTQGAVAPCFPSLGLDLTSESLRHYKAGLPREPHGGPPGTPSLHQAACR